MRKAFFIPLVGVVVLLIALLLLHNVRTSTDIQKTTFPIINPKPVNLDSLMTLIRKDKRYRIEDVFFDHKDSNLVITINGETATTRYFDSIYHLATLPSIDGLIILNTNNRQLAAYSNRNIRLLTAFKAQWCSADECLPLTTRIKNDLAVAVYVRPIKLWIQCLGDSTFVITDSVQLIRADGHVTTERVHAQINMEGTILAYDNRQ